MQILFKQNKRYGCPFYALANLFNEPRFLDYIEEDQGGFVEHMNRAIRELVPDHFLSCLFCVHSSLPVQNRFFDTVLFDIDLSDCPEEIKQNNFRPFVATIKMLHVHHSILVIQEFKTGKLYVYNSLMQLVQEFTVEEFVLNYWVTELYIFESEEIRKLCRYGGPSHFLSWSFDQLPHLKP